MLLPIFGKLFERIIFNSLFNYLEESEILTACQSGFWCNDSCLSQLSAIAHDVCNAFYANAPLKTHFWVFLDMTKAVGSVWSAGLVFKLNSVGVSGDLLNTNNLNNRF